MFAAALLLTLLLPQTRSAAATAPAITAPVPGSVLASSAVTFRWSAGTGASEYRLSVGSLPGGSDVFSRSTGLTRSASVTDLPLSGATLFVRLWWKVGGGWQYVDQRYATAGPATGTPMSGAAPSPAPRTATPPATAATGTASPTTNPAAPPPATAVRMPTPTPAPVAAATPAAAGAAEKRFGVSVAGAEFSETKLPGRLNWDYLYAADANRQQYFARKGLTLIRVGFLWERLQPAAFGPLSPPDVAGLRSMLDAAYAANQVVILDLHNYGRYYGVPMGRGQGAQFADFWARAAREFRGHPALFGYELMNEPHDLPGGGDDWAYLAQVATDAIRQYDQDAYVLVPGYGWQSARFWPDNNQTLNVSDPSNRLLYAAHQYFDLNYDSIYAGRYEDDRAYPMVGVDLIKPFQDWLAARNARGIFTEYGVPDTDGRWVTVLENFLAAVQADPRLVGGTYWSSGPWWGQYPLSVEPVNGVDRPQMRAIAKYPSTNPPAAPTATPTRSATPATPTRTPTPVVTPTRTPTSSPTGTTSGRAFAVLSPERTLTSTELLAWKAAGGTQIEVVAFWNRLQAAPGAPLDAAALGQLQRQIDDARRAGLDAMLTVAVQYPPAFVQANVPKFRDQHGAEWTASDASGDNVRDWIWSATGRQYLGDYITKVVQGLNLNGVAAIRIGGVLKGELQFPSTGAKPYRFWGYGAAAQTGQGLAAGMSATPLPGYVPYAANSTEAQDSRWSNWYLDSLATFLQWQIRQYRQAGWPGDLYVLHPSWGMRSNWTRADAGYQEAVAQGQDWSRMIAAYAQEANVWPWSTWIDSRDTPYYPGPDSEKAPWRKLYDVALTYGKSARIRGENTGGQGNADMDRVFREAMAYGYQGLAWLSWSTLSTQDQDTLANLQRLIGAR